MKATVQLKQRGVIVIPEAVRIALKLKEGDIIIMDIKKHDTH